MLTFTISQKNIYDIMSYPAQNIQVIAQANTLISLILEMFNLHTYRKYTISCSNTAASVEPSARILTQFVFRISSRIFSRYV